MWMSLYNYTIKKLNLGLARVCAELLAYCYGCQRFLSPDTIISLDSSEKEVHVCFDCWKEGSSMGVFTVGCTPKIFWCFCQSKNLSSFRNWLFSLKNHLSEGLHVCYTWASFSSKVKLNVSFGLLEEIKSNVLKALLKVLIEPHVFTN